MGERKREKEREKGGEREGEIGRERERGRERVRVRSERETDGENVCVLDGMPVSGCLCAITRKRERESKQATVSEKL